MTNAEAIKRIAAEWDIEVSSVEQHASGDFAVFMPSGKKYLPVAMFDGSEDSAEGRVKLVVDIRHLLEMWSGARTRPPPPTFEELEADFKAQAAELPTYEESADDSERSAALKAKAEDVR